MGEQREQFPLGEQATGQVIRLLNDAVDEGDNLTARFAAKALGLIGDRSISNVLVMLLKSDDRFVACEAALAVFEEMGAIVTPVEDGFASTEPIWLILTQSFWNARFRRYVAEFGPSMSETLLRQMDDGAGHSAVALQQAMFERTRIFREIQRWFARCDIPQAVVRSRASMTIRWLILELPCSRSTKVMGTSRTLKPRWMAR